MSKFNRIPKPRHLFPDAAAWFINGKRGLLRLRWALREDQDWFPAWSFGAMAGVTGMLLAVLLFFLDNPQVSASPSLSTESASTLEKPLVSSEPVTPTLSTDFNPIFPLRNYERSRLTGSTLTRTEFPFLWDQNEVAVLRSRPRRVEERFIKDHWTTTTPNLAQVETFRPYILQGTTIPLTPVYVTSSPQRGELDGFRSLRQQGITIEKHTQPTTSLGEPYTYVIHVTNSTNDAIDQVYLHEQISAIHRVSDVSPPASVRGDELIWSLGELPARSRKALQVTLIPDTAKQIETKTTLRNLSSIGGLASVQNPVPVTIPAPQPVFQALPEPGLLPVDPDDSILPSFRNPAPIPEQKPEPQPEPPPLTVSEIPEPKTFPELKLAVTPAKVLKKGETLTLTFSVTNVGNAPAKDVSLHVNLSGEFKHKYGERVKHTITRLEPGQTRRALLQATANETGTGRLAASLLMEGDETKSEELMIQVESGTETLSNLPETAPGVMCQRPELTEEALQYTAERPQDAEISRQRNEGAVEELQPTLAASAAITTQTPFTVNASAASPQWRRVTE